MNKKETARNTARAIKMLKEARELIDNAIYSVKASGSLYFEGGFDSGIQQVIEDAQASLQSVLDEDFDN